MTPFKRIFSNYCLLGMGFVATKVGTDFDMISFVVVAVIVSTIATVLGLMK